MLRKPDRCRIWREEENGVDALGAPGLDVRHIRDHAGGSQWTQFVVVARVLRGPCHVEEAAALIAEIDHVEDVLGTRAEIRGVDQEGHDVGARFGRRNDA